MSFLENGLRHTKFFFWGNPDADINSFPSYLTKDLLKVPEPYSLAYAKRITTVTGGALTAGSLIMGGIIQGGQLAGVAAAIQTALPAFIFINSMPPAAFAFYALATILTAAVIFALSIMAVVNAVQADNLGTTYHSRATAKLAGQGYHEI